MKVSDIFTEAFENEGIKYVFNIPGEKI